MAGDDVDPRHVIDGASESRSGGPFRGHVGGYRTKPKFGETDAPLKNRLFHSIRRLQLPTRLLTAPFRERSEQKASSPGASVEREIEGVCGVAERKFRSKDVPVRRVLPS